MNHRPHRAFAVLAVSAFAAPTMAQGTPIGFPETYALAPDRAAAVGTLIPGTEEWYYYTCRLLLDARDFAGVRAQLEPWIKRHGRTERVVEIESREALLGFDDDPERTWRYVRQQLGLTWTHQRETAGERSDLPTELDQSLLSPVRLTQRALRESPGTVNGFEDRALAPLLGSALDPAQLHSLLQRLDRPDVDNLPALIVRDLAQQHSRGFGSLPIHGMLRLPQLEECIGLRPELLNQPEFVNAYLVRLQPRTDTTWQSDPTALAEQLQRLWQFAQRLAPAHNSLKAHVLYHWLQLDLARGAVDKERFLTYIRLPRTQGYVAADFLQRHRGQPTLVDCNRTFPTDLPPIGDDTALVRACLEQFFATEDGYRAYAEYLDERWLKAVLAETKILLGQGDMERWYSLLDNPRLLEQIEQRVEITFAPTQPTHYDATDPVALAVDVKNVPTLVLKVFVIDSYRYLVERQRDVDATIELDGLVANYEKTFEYDEPPLRRVRRTFDLPMLAEPGTYVVELVGNGISSRAVVHKGTLRHVERTAAAGQLFRIYDEQGGLQKNALLWFGGKEYAADGDGDILVPFSTDPGAKKAVVRVGNRSALIRFEHRAETFALTAEAHVAREELIAGQTAELALRPRLWLDGHRVAIGLLQDPVLTVTAVDIDGTRRSTEVREPKLIDDREFVHPFSVPERLQRLEVGLRGRVRDLNGNDVTLATDHVSFAVNGIDITAETVAAMLVPLGDGYAVEVRGKNGEVVASQPCQLRLKHRDYKRTVDVALQTDASGRIALGPLTDIDRVQVDVVGGTGSGFSLRGARSTVPAVLHGRAGETLRLPYLGHSSTVERAEFSLLAHDTDLFSHLALASGFLELRDLPPGGDYELRLHETGDVVRVRVTAGPRDGEWIVGENRVLQATRREPLNLRSIVVTGEDLRIGVTNFGKATRVHVLTTRFLPTFDPFDFLRGRSAAAPRVFFAEAEPTTYHAGRKLGDEYRYILERRFAPKFAGNMLRRPSLLLNPWALDRDSWNAAVGLGGGAGGRFGGRSGSRAAAGAEPAWNPANEDGTGPGTFANLDYLPQGAVAHLDLVPDENGVVRLKTADLGDGQVVHVLAIDGDEVLYDRILLEERPLQPRSRTQAAALAADDNFVEEKRIEFVAAGGEAVIADARSAEVEIFDSLAGVYRFMSTMTRDPELAKFAFVLRWPQLDDAEKRALYSEYACHELHFFLYQKDRAFFDAAVRPYLANKLDKTFVDHWLLGDDLRRFLEPWAFAQLNLIEKILLAQRLDGGERAAIARVIREQHELRPTDRERLDALITAALGTSDLDSDDDGIAILLSAKLADPAQKPAETAAVPPGGPATMGPTRKAESRRQAGRDRSAEDEAGAADAPTTGSDDFFLGRARHEIAADKELVEEVAERGAVAQLYRAVQPTKLLVESNYWRRTVADTTPGIVAASTFWVDYASAASDQPFVSPAFVEASGSFLEMMFALAVLDLPFEPGQHAVASDGNTRTLRAATPLLLVRKEVTRATVADDEPPLLLGENLFRLDERFQYDSGVQREKFVNDEFLTSTPYGAQVVVSNPTAQRRTVDVLLQIPAGALPVQRGFWTRSIAVDLSPYETKPIEYAFYFPAPGDFAHYPAHAATKGRLVAAAEARTLRVVTTPSRIDTRSWQHVSQQGTAAEVLDYLDGHNLQRIDLAKIAWRLRDRQFFLTVTERLRQRHVYDDTVWSYAVLHRDPDAAREYLRHAESLLRRCGAALASTLVVIDPVERGVYQHLELDPLVHARAHRLGSQPVIGNADLARQYLQLLDILGYHRLLSSEDWLDVTYYLLLQDRVEEALAAFGRIAPAELAARIQYDYLSAYVAFFTGDTERARRIAESHRDHPVAHWQKRFGEMLAQLDEAEGKLPATGDPQSADALAAKAPAIELALEGRTAHIAHRNLDRCEVRYYELDVEFAFSAQPFASTSGTAAAYVQPNLREVHELPADKDGIAFELPGQFRNKNVLVEVRAGGLVRSQTFFANTLDVRFLESYGQVAVSDPRQQRPLPKTYVKVFARLPNGQVRFHKDGYTDLRGRFDYASVSDDPNAGAERYAVLVLDEQLGAVIRDVAPPAR
ncbi:MAG: hypothetical protein KDE27_09810 [Planctomycetes bacterium]|nr:hypothetical protein [Planctomycetota bacterium]